MPRYFCAERIYHNGRLCSDTALALSDDGRVLGLLPYSDVKYDCVDFGARILAPSWLDLQVNGCGGALFNRDLDLPCLEKILRSSLRHGAGGVQPTLITCSDEEMTTALELVHQAQKKAPQKDQEKRQGKAGENLLWQALIGMHLEGPYISVARRGAHPSQLIRPLDEAALQRLEAAGRAGVLTYITVAAEAVRPEQVARLAASGPAVSLGHSEAPARESRRLLRAGARCFTHLYNAMGGINSREPRTLSLALEDQQACSSIIADGHHVAAENIRIAQRLLGERLFLVTDATATADGAEDLVFFGGQPCTIENGMIRNEEGSLAGSALTMQRGVEILAHLFGLETALAMASANPARALQHPDYPGSLIPGSRGNFVVFGFSGQRISDLETRILGRNWQEE